MPYELTRVFRAEQIPDPECARLCYAYTGGNQPDNRAWRISALESHPSLPSGESTFHL